MVKQTAGRDALGTFAPQFAALNDDVLFGEVWSREDKLSSRDRSIVTVTTLMASGILDSSLKFHLANAKKHGVTQEEIAEIITHAAFMPAGQKHGRYLIWQRKCGRQAKAIFLMKMRQCVHMPNRWYFRSESQTMHLPGILSDRVILHRYRQSRLAYLM